ncbi:hypothetical protein MRB53_020611 [Persea americana]|uniref:Uncharacterized protein n=1 Tax=Persea americana TaxID=3435 RepID=A0ACC2L1H7_PERAE|nr:hypothetical protein MRB53_020611 [Persea americana]
MHEETSEARLIVQDGDETVHLPSTELGDTPLKAETVDPFINKEAASIEERPIAIDSEETILEPPVQFSELPLESTSQLEAEGDPSNTIAYELLVVPEPSTAIYGTGAATDDLTRVLAIETRVICTSAIDFLEEQPEEVMDDSEEEIEIDTSIIACTSSATLKTIEGSAHDASFELVPSPALLKEQKDTMKIMLLGITQTLTSGKFTQLTNCRRAANNIFGMNRAPLDIRPLRLSLMSFLLSWKV